MKKLISVCLMAFLALSISCNKDDVTLEQQNQNSDNTEVVNELEKSKINQKNSITTGQENYSRGFGDDGSGSGGINIYDGTNYNDGPPNGYHWTLLITYAPGVTDTQKQEYRVQYQVTGELWYFEQCPNDPQKELWYFVPDSSPIPCQLPWPMNCRRGDTPPQSPPSGFCLITINQTCDL